MKKLILVAAMLMAAIPAAQAGCVLKREAFPDDPKCYGAVGYANGARIGFFHWQGANVSVGGKCTGSHPSGQIVGSNRIQTGGGVRTLTDDCRRTM